MAKVYLLLGGNIGDTITIFQDAISHINAGIGLIKGISSIYRSPAWGFECENDFLNQVACIETNCLPEDLIRLCLTIEAEMGRTRKDMTSGYSSRNIDIDVLLYGQMQINSERITVPHPRMHLRKFTLMPLAEIAPLTLHPTLGMTITELLALCPDTSVVQKIYQ